MTGTAAYIVFLLTSPLTEPQQEIVISQAPRPLRYQIEVRVDCGERSYVVAVENQGASKSRVVASTMDDRPVEFTSLTTNFASAVSQISVAAIKPSICISETGMITLNVIGYDSELDKLEGQTGEVSLTFTSSDDMF